MIGIIICSVLLTVAAVLILIRVAIGPSMLDRAVALDVFVAVVTAAIALQAAWNRDTATLPILIALAVVGFIGSTIVARFASREPEKQDAVRDQYPTLRSEDRP